MLTYQFGVPQEKVGYYAGYIATAYYAGQLVSNFPFCWLSDRVGRKPVLVGGIISNILVQTAFGLSERYWFCVFLRFLNGASNSYIPLSKCYVREISDETNQGRVFALREVGFAVGSMVAPLLGSLFARPTD